MDIRLLAGQQQKVAVGMAAAGFEVAVHLSETDRAGVAGMPVRVEVRHHGDVDAARPEGGQPRRLQVERSGIAQLLGEVRVEMACGDFVSGKRLVEVVMRVGQDLLQRGPGFIRAEVEVDGHSLLGSGGRVVEREIALRKAAGLADARLPQLVRDAVGTKHFLAVAVAHTHGIGLFVVLAIPHVTQVRLDLAGPEEFVRRRKHRDRPAGGFDNGKAVAGTQSHGSAVGRPAELVLLPVARSVAPDDPRRIGRAKACQAAGIFIRHAGFASLGNGFLTDEVDPL